MASAVNGEFSACTNRDCRRLARPPFVCNGCVKEHNCPMRKKFYISKSRWGQSPVQLVGRTNFPSGSMSRLMDSLKKLTALPPKTVVVPGHGPETTIAEEIRSNPFLA